jgi:hypothetical protein
MAPFVVDPSDLKGVVVSPTEPMVQEGKYWGYSTRLASSIEAVFAESGVGVSAPR